MDKAWEENELHHVMEYSSCEQATVSFGDTSLCKIGEVLTPTIVQNPPVVNWKVEEGQFYSVFMTDPDAPSRENPKFREWYHWGVINIPGNDVSKGEEIAAYVGAGPPKGTGKHRYVILVFKQPGKINYTGDKIGMTGSGRASQKIVDIVKKHNLGNIVAAACFQAEWDDYVPELMKKLK